MAPERTDTNTRTLLIAESSEDVSEQFTHALEQDYCILHAADGAEALALMRKHTDEISVVLLDLDLPVKDGYQVLAEKSFDASIAGIPVIALSENGEASVELRALNSGAIDFLTKPAESEIVQRRVKLAVDQRELEALHIQNRIYEERQFVVDHDALTGIYSKTAFYRETQTMLDEHPHAQFFILRWDIEKFKLINNLFGMDIGDRVLQQAAESLRRQVAGRGTYGRYESDNFVACVEGEAKEAERIVTRIVDDLRSSFADVGLTQTLMIAAGVYPIEDNDISVDEMCDRAALAQQTVKGDYTRHLAYYNATLHKRLLQEQDILSNMERALAEGEFEVYLQPIYSMSTKQVASAEALVRWNRPGEGIVAPGVFIPLFERNGFISSLDRQMWQQVCRIQADRQAQNLPDLPISVNVSRKSLYNPYLAEEIEELAHYYRIEPHLFRIEITESAYMDNAEQLMATVAKLQHAGFLVLMDDFGSGYSSLNTLKDIPVDMLKLDMRFMEGFDSGGRVGTVMASVLRMAKWLGVPVIAEGVETPDQYAFLQSAGCEYVQGFYLARPMPYAQFEDYIAQQQGAPHAEEKTIPVDLVNLMMGGDSVTPRVLSALFDGVAIFEFSGDAVEVLRADQGYFDMFGYDASTFKMKGNMLADRISADDYEQVLAACKFAEETGGAGRACIRQPETGEAVRMSCIIAAQENDARSLVVMGFLFEGNNRDK